ncbi:hypothetical protein BPOR_0421g00060 [Botrytis porri]|uniref:Uncharacterized protein n=1 Tax=Botrytis porri TaxID=87229 RepID=A0A4Z1KI18_9HELO|nr:hypothetical protein BPOR_0421g00060 [Botrytis porri]
MSESKVKYLTLTGRRQVIINKECSNGGVTTVTEVEEVEEVEEVSRETKSRLMLMFMPKLNAELYVGNDRGKMSAAEHLLGKKILEDTNMY